MAREKHLIKVTYIRQTLFLISGAMSVLDRKSSRKPDEFDVDPGWLIYREVLELPGCDYEWEVEELMGTINQCLERYRTEDSPLTKIKKYRGFGKERDYS